MKQKKSNLIKVVNADSVGQLSRSLEKVQTNKIYQAVILSFTDEMLFTENNDSDENLLNLIRHFPIPLITLIKTEAKGLLFEIVLASHLCIASDAAIFEIADKDLLKKQIGSANADKLKRIKDIIDAETAYELGIINKITPAENLEKDALEIADKISMLAPIAIRYCLEAVNNGLEMSLENGLELETKLFCGIFATEDMKEGTSSFLEKRKPVFKGI